jgi:hypothetical protein
LPQGRPWTLKLKTTSRDGTMHLVTLPQKYTQRRIE